MEFVLEWIENKVGEGENVSYQHFLLFAITFQMPFYV